MKKIFNYYILSAKEMDEIQYTIDWYHKLKCYTNVVTVVANKI